MIFFSFPVLRPFTYQHSLFVSFPPFIIKLAITLLFLKLHFKFNILQYLTGGPRWHSG